MSVDRIDEEDVDRERNSGDERRAGVPSSSCSVFVVRLGDEYRGWGRRHEPLGVVAVIRGIDRVLCDSRKQLLLMRVLSSGTLDMDRDFLQDRVFEFIEIFLRAGWETGATGRMDRLRRCLFVGEEQEWSSFVLSMSSFSRRSAFVAEVKRG